MPSTSAPPRLHFEDVEIGRTVAFGRKQVTKEEIVAFARAFDPQPLHLDEEAARHTLVGRLCASGWHSCAMLMRMLADDVLANAASLGSPGIDEVKFLMPVLPGDVLTGRYQCTEKRVLRSRPHVGLCKIVFEMLNQEGEVVLRWDSNQLLGLRAPAGTETRS
jgi:acyl dehydratase